MKANKQRIRQLRERLTHPGISSDDEQRYARRLAAQLHDPSLLLREEWFTPEHILMKEARIISDALETVTNGIFEEEPLQALETLPKNSAFHSWHLLIDIIRAYYQQDSATIKQRLGEMEENASEEEEPGLPVTLLPLLHALARTEEPDLPSIQEKLFRTICDTRSSLKSDLQMVEELSRDTTLHTLILRENLVLALRDLMKDDPANAREMALWGMDQLTEREEELPEYLNELRTILGEDEVLRLTAISTFSEDPDISLLYWIRYARAAFQKEGVPRERLQALLIVIRDLASVVLEETPDGEEEDDFRSALDRLAASLVLEAAAVFPEQFPENRTDTPQQPVHILAGRQTQPVQQEAAQPTIPEKPAEPQKREPAAASAKPVQLELFAC